MKSILEIMRYSAVGVANTISDLTVFSVLLLYFREIGHLVTGMNLVMILALLAKGGVNEGDVGP